GGGQAGHGLEIRVGERQRQAGAVEIDQQRNGRQPRQRGPYHRHQQEAVARVQLAAAAARHRPDPRPAPERRQEAGEGRGKAASSGSAAHTTDTSRKPSRACSSLRQRRVTAQTAAPPPKASRKPSRNAVKPPSSPMYATSSGSSMVSANTTMVRPAT